MVLKIELNHKGMHKNVGVKASSVLHGLSLTLERKLSENPGASVSIKENVEPKDGFMVGILNLATVPLTDLSLDEAMVKIGYELTSFKRREFIHEAYVYGTKSNNWSDDLYVGFWYDKMDKLLYLDLSARFDDEATALEAAKENGEKAIFDILKGEAKTV